MFPQPDAKTGVIEQFDAYFKLKEATIEELKARKLHPDEYLGAGQGLAVPTKVIKQADVVMMLNLFKDRYPTAIKQANWEYYEPRTEHGSSLSACAYAMVAAEYRQIWISPTSIFSKRRRLTSKPNIKFMLAPFSWAARIRRPTAVPG